MSAEAWPVCRTVVAHFAPAPGGPPVRSSRGRLAYDPHPQLTHHWRGKLVVVTPGGREQVVRLWLIVRGGRWFLAVLAEGLDRGAGDPDVIELEPLDAAAPHACEVRDYFGEGAPVRLFLAPAV
jgi:hypothetical protein